MANPTFIASRSTTIVTLLATLTLTALNSACDPNMHDGMHDGDPQVQDEAGNEPSDEPSSDEVTLTDEELVTAFISEVLEGGDLDAAGRYLADDLIQHNPQLDDGLDNFRAYLEQAAAAGLTTESYHPWRILSEGDYVITHSELVVTGQPTSAVADIFRLEGEGADRRIVELWDVIQTVPDEQLPEGQSMFDGGVPDLDAYDAKGIEELKRLTITATDRMWNLKDFDAAGEIFDARYINHNPGSPNTFEGFLSIIEPFLATVPDFHFSPKRIFAQGDFVVVHGQYTAAAEDCGNDAAGPFIAVDIFRYDSQTDTILEHWDVLQAPPEVIVGRSMLDGAGLYRGEYGQSQPCP